MAKIITESFETEITKGKNLYIEGIFSQADTLVANDRIYPKKILDKEVTRILPKVREKKLLGELEHPNSPSIGLGNAAILIEKLEWSGNDLIGRAKVLDTPAGETLKAIVKDCTVGISSRGLGTVDKETKMVNEDFMLITWDVVSQPSVNSAWVNGIYESKDIDIKQHLLTEQEQNAFDNTISGLFKRLEYYNQKGMITESQDLSNLLFQMVKKNIKLF